MGLIGQKVHRQTRGKPVPYQARVSPNLKGAQSAFLLGTLKPFLHMPSTKGDLHQGLQRFFRRCIADKILLFAGVLIMGNDQPISAVRWNRTMRLAAFVPDQINLSRFDMPIFQVGR